jgi:hypothetical protein
LEFLDRRHGVVLLGRSTCHVKHLRSSTSSRKYFLPFRVVGVMGPQRLPWTRLRVLLTHWCVCSRKEVRQCLPVRQASQICSSCGRPSTMSWLARWRSERKLMCPK